MQTHWNIFWSLQSCADFASLEGPAQNKSYHSGTIFLILCGHHWLDTLHNQENDHTIIHFVPIILMHTMKPNIHSLFKTSTYTYCLNRVQQLHFFQSYFFLCCWIPNMQWTCNWESSFCRCQPASLTRNVFFFANRIRNHCFPLKSVFSKSRSVTTRHFFLSKHKQYDQLWTSKSIVGTG